MATARRLSLETGSSTPGMGAGRGAVGAVAALDETRVPSKWRHVHDARPQVVFVSLVVRCLLLAALAALATLAALAILDAHTHMLYCHARYTTCNTYCLPLY